MSSERKLSAVHLILLIKFREVHAIHKIQVDMFAY